MTRRRMRLLYTGQTPGCQPMLLNSPTPADGGTVELMIRCTWPRSSSLKRLVLGLVFCSLLPGASFAQSYKVDTSDTQSLTSYLRQHRLPLVGAQVLTNGAGDRRIVLYGFVATQFGKND